MCERVIFKSRHPLLERNHPYISIYLHIQLYINDEEIKKTLTSGWLVSAELGLENMTPGFGLIFLASGLLNHHAARQVLGKVFKELWSRTWAIGQLQFFQVV